MTAAYDRKGHAPGSAPGAGPPPSAAGRRKLCQGEDSRPHPTSSPFSTSAVTAAATTRLRRTASRGVCPECAERLCYTCRECGGLHERSSFRKGSGESSSLLRPRVLQKRVQGPLARIIAFRTPPLIHPSLLKQPSRDVHVPTDGYHLPRCIRDNGPAGPRKVARRARNTKHDKRGERQMPDPGRQHRGRRAFRPQPNKLRS